jgi:FAD:protein FMN transferase
MSTTMNAEASATFACFGSDCTVIVAARRHAEAEAAVQRARIRLLEWHDQFSRFQPDSEISALNRDPADTVKVTPLMRRVIAAALWAARMTDGLVDPTLVGEIEAAGYAGHFDGSAALPVCEALTLAPARTAARPSSRARWREVAVDRRSNTVTRPPGVRIDPGGIAKGVFADELAALLGEFDAFAIDCAGDLRLGGSAGLARPVLLDSPFAGGEPLHTFALAVGGVATSGIGRRAWLHDGRPSHHLLDPATGRPAYTGIVQVTALAPTATEAEARSKAALLSGPEGAAAWLETHGGLIVLDDGSHRAIEPASVA